MGLQPQDPSLCAVHSPFLNTQDEPGAVLGPGNVNRGELIPS